MLPLDVTGLMQVHDDHEADEDLVDVPVDDVLEHDHMVAEVKSLSIVQEASIHSRSFLGKEINCLYNSPSTHIYRAFCLISKLIWIIVKLIFKEKKNHPVKHLQQYRTQCNSSIVSTFICGTSFILDQKNDSTNEQGSINDSMNKNSLEEICKVNEEADWSILEIVSCQIILWVIFTWFYFLSDYLLISSGVTLSRSRIS